MKHLFFLITLCLGLGSQAQSAFFEASDSINKKRLITSSALIGGFATSSNILLAQIWYADFDRVKWHTFDDASNWMQVDKVGHAYASYQFSSLVAKTYRWSGVKRPMSALIGFGASWAYQFSIEVLDGRSAQWGFSWSDVAANTMGSSLFLAQELLLKEQFIKFKFAYNESGLAKYRPSYLGSTFPEKLLKDYNAQKYWLSFSPFYFSNNEKHPKWLAIAIGYGAYQKFVGDSDSFTTVDGSQSFEAKREWMLSLDIDVQKLPIKNRWLKMALSPFNTIKFPFPALVWRGNTLYAMRSY